MLARHVHSTSPDNRFGEFHGYHQILEKRDGMTIKVVVRALSQPRSRHSVETADPPALRHRRGQGHRLVRTVRPRSKPTTKTMNVPAASVDDSSALRLLPLVLSLVAGSVDIIGFLWHGLFVAHITGNLALVAARVVAGSSVGIATILSLPVFVVMLSLISLAVVRLESAEIPSLRPLLLIQFVFLAAFFGVASLAGTHSWRNSATTVSALMLGVCALATQNELVQSSIRGAAPTAVMTTNLTRFVHDVTEILLGTNVQSTEAARSRAAHTWPAIAGFLVGAAVGASLYAAVGIESLALPVGLAILVVVLLRAHKPDQETRPRVGPNVALSVGVDG